MKEKEQKLEEYEQDFLRRNTDVRELERALEDERRKSMLDIEKIKRLEAELKNKVQ